MKTISFVDFDPGIGNEYSMDYYPGIGAYWNERASLITLIVPSEQLGGVRTFYNLKIGKTGESLFLRDARDGSADGGAVDVHRLFDQLIELTTLRGKQS